MLALLGMAGTLIALVAFMAPSVLDGNDPLLVAVVAASAIAFVSLYLVHGLNSITTVALAGTLSSLGLTLALSWAFFEFAHFTGLASEEALTLPFIFGSLDVPSLILGGAVIGALGALDDITVTQAALVAELRYRNPTRDSPVGYIRDSGWSGTYRFHGEHPSVGLCRRQHSPSDAASRFQPIAGDGGEL